MLKNDHLANGLKNKDENLVNNLFTLLSCAVEWVSWRLTGNQWISLNFQSQVSQYNYIIVDTKRLANAYYIVNIINHINLVAVVKKKSLFVL